MLARKLFVGGAWSILARLAGRLVDLATLLVLARLLTPADFGVVAVGMTLVTILEAVFELPVGAVLLRQPDLTRADFDTAFTLAALRGLVLGGTCLLLARPFALIYGDPQLATLVAVLSLAPALRGLTSPRMVLFAKALDFRRSFMVDVTGRLAACLIATLIAITWRNYWAIVASTVAGPAFGCCLSYILAPHRPRLSLARWQDFRHFFGWSSATQLVSAINWQSDRLLLGRLIPPAVLGQYSMASDLSALPSQTLLAPLMVPTLAAFSKLGHDPARLSQAYGRLMSALVAFGMPMLAGLSLVAEPLVALVLGGKWTSASWLLQWLALDAIPFLFIMPVWPLAMATGQVRVLFQRSAMELAIKLPMLVAGALLFGVAGVVGSRIVVTTITAGISLHLTGRILGSTIATQVAAQWRPALSCLMMVLAVVAADSLFPVASLLPVVQLGFQVALGAIVYAGSMYVLGFRPNHLLEALPKSTPVAAE